MPIKIIIAAICILVGVEVLYVKREDGTIPL